MNPGYYLSNLDNQGNRPGFGAHPTQPNWTTFDQVHHNVNVNYAPYGQPVIPVVGSSWAPNNFVLAPMTATWQQHFSSTNDGFQQQQRHDQSNMTHYYQQAGASSSYNYPTQFPGGYENYCEPADMPAITYEVHGMDNGWSDMRPRHAASDCISFVPCTQPNNNAYSCCYSPSSSSAFEQQSCCVKPAAITLPLAALLLQTPPASPPSSSLLYCSPTTTTTRTLLKKDCEWFDGTTSDDFPLFSNDEKPNTSHQSLMASQNPTGLVKITRPVGQQTRLWQFLLRLLFDPQRFESVIHWTMNDDWEFNISNPNLLAQLWGQEKRNPKMNFAHLSRALRFYYLKEVLCKPQRKGKKEQTYKFVNIKEILQVLDYNAVGINRNNKPLPFTLLVDLARAERRPVSPSRKH